MVSPLTMIPYQKAPPLITEEVRQGVVGILRLIEVIAVGEGQGCGW